MADSATKTHSLPPEMRALAEQGVEQAKKTFDQLMAATRHAVSAFEGQTAAAQTAARELQQQAMEFAERNITASFEFAQNLARAQSAEELAKIHADFVTEQMRALAGQARELASNAGKAAARAAKPG
jgi:phasin